jgi:cytochrome c biogenesis protein CcmG, thiol:disulfide interchange protein DsbE
VSVRTTVVVLAALAVVGLLTYGLVKKGGSALALGQVVPGATTSLPELDGNGSASVADYRGRWVLVNVWASWCPPCQSESPDLEQYYDANRGKDFTIVGVDTNDLSTDGLRFVKDHNITYPQLHDGNGDFATNDLKTTGVPESFLVNPQGKLVLHSLGPVTERYLDANVTPFITGKAKQ